MTNTKFLVSSTVVLAFVAAGPAGAGDPAKSKPPKAERYQVDPEVQRMVEEQTRRPVVAPELPVLEWETSPDVESNRVSARLLSTGDQTVLVAVRLTADQKDALTQLWPTVETIDQADHQTILGDELILRYPLVLEFDLHRLDAKIGQVIELELGNTKDQRPIVLFVRGS
jgi:hypothetical protein